MAQSARLEFRVHTEAKAQIEHAAELLGLAVSDFVRAAAEARADQVLRNHALVTSVPTDFFDSLLAALDEPAQPNAALVRAARRRRDMLNP
jgi:uncharacterized protein (DUF1778 family)